MTKKFDKYNCEDISYIGLLHLGKTPRLADKRCSAFIKFPQRRSVGNSNFSAIAVFD